MSSAGFYTSDPWLKPFWEVIESRNKKCQLKEKLLTGGKSLTDFSTGHHYYGIHKVDSSWVLREWAPNAIKIYFIGPTTGWKEKSEFMMKKIDSLGNWEIIIPSDILKHGDLYKLSVYWNGGKGERIPSYAKRVVQDESTKIFSAQIWDNPVPYKWNITKFKPDDNQLLIYEAHIGMATAEEKTGSYSEFTQNVLPVIKKSGYNTIQLMAIQEHPFYGSFGYHVSNYFAASSRFGTPEELKELIDKAHGLGLRVIMDLIHSHSVKNINEGLGLFDGNPGQYFHTGKRRLHVAWDSLCFDYSKNEVIHFLLSNCLFWMDEYKFDGFRFDGVTSMIYYDHGLERNFTSYNEYFDGYQDEEALVYLYLANKLIHSYNTDCVTIAEEMSGMPGIAALTEDKGFGFDFRLSMGVPDYWIKLIKEMPDEKWDIGKLFNELTQRRAEEKVISYCESHDQALVGDKTLIFRMIDAEMYSGMDKKNHSILIDRGIALHKMIRLITFGTSGGGYLNFMGNEFGHPEWIDFPREGNNWSYKYARRLWYLSTDENLKYSSLAKFDSAMLNLHHEFGLLNDSSVIRIYVSENDKVIAFTRADLLFVFNFHPSISFTDYGIPIEGKFRIILGTDDTLFGGFDRIDKNISYISIRKSEKNSIDFPMNLYLYLPSRTAIVLKKVPVRRVTDI
jgi:1,4-alpha-glucan branching enzyme